MRYGVTNTVAVLLILPSLAVTVIVVFEITLGNVTARVVLVTPALMVTLLTILRVALLLLSVIVFPSFGAGPINVMTRFALLPPLALIGSIVKDANAPGLRVGVAVGLTRVVTKVGVTVLVGVTVGVVVAIGVVVGVEVGTTEPCFCTCTVAFLYCRLPLDPGGGQLTAAPSVTLRSNVCVWD